MEVVDKLLQHGARVDLQSKVCFTFQNSPFLVPYHEQNGTSSLIVASENGHVEVVDKLLENGARVDLQENVSFIMPFQIHVYTT